MQPINLNINWMDFKYEPLVNLIAEKEFFKIYFCNWISKIIAKYPEASIKPLIKCLNSLLKTNRVSSNNLDNLLAEEI